MVMFIIGAACGRNFPREEFDLVWEQFDLGLHCLPLSSFLFQGGGSHGVLHHKRLKTNKSHGSFFFLLFVISDLKHNE